MPISKALGSTVPGCFPEAERGGGYPADHTCTPHLHSVGPSRNASLPGASRQNPSPACPLAGARAFSPSGLILILSLIPAKKRVHRLTAE